MRQSVRIGRFAGIPVGVHWSVAVIFGLLTWELADAVLPGTYGGTSHPVYWAAAVVAAVLFFLSLLAHEASHAVVARRLGVGVRSITLWLFGGVAQLEGEARTPAADFAIAAVGPATSLALVAVFGAAQLVFEQAGGHGLAATVAGWLWEINLLLAAFNLVPAAPLDGGRILRAGLWRWSGDRDSAALRAAQVGVVFGAVLIGLGVVEFVAGSAFGIWPAFLGWFLVMAARAEQGAARERHGVQGLTVAAVMDPRPALLPATLPVAHAVTRPWWPGGDTAAVVGPSGWLAGVVTFDRLRSVPVHAQATTTVGDVAEPIGEVPVGRPWEAMPDLLTRMYVAGGSPALVLGPDDRLAGVISLGDVARAGYRRAHVPPQDPATAPRQQDLAGEPR